MKKEIQSAKLPNAQKQYLYILANEVQRAARRRLLDDVQDEYELTSSGLKVYWVLLSVCVSPCFFDHLSLLL